MESESRGWTEYLHLAQSLAGWLCRFHTIRSIPTRLIRSRGDRKLVPGWTEHLRLAQSLVSLRTGRLCRFHTIRSVQTRLIRSWEGGKLVPGWSEYLRLAQPLVSPRAGRFCQYFVSTISRRPWRREWSSRPADWRHARCWSPRRHREDQAMDSPRNLQCKLSPEHIHK